MPGRNHHTVTLLALGLALAGALSWAVGIVLVKRMCTLPVFSLVVWLSLIPPIPALLVFRLDHGVPSLWHALLGAFWTSIVALIYRGAVATVLVYAIWGYLLARYPAASVAPFTLLGPCSGAIAAALIFGKRYSAMRYAGMALILAGLVASVMPVTWHSRDHARFRAEHLDGPKR